MNRLIMIIITKRRKQFFSKIYTNKINIITYITFGEKY